MLRGLITWQWAPDCRPARQAGQLLGLTRLGSIFSLTEFFGSSFSPCARKHRRIARDRVRDDGVMGKRKAGIEAGFPSRDACNDQAFLGACDTHQPFAFTALPGNSWHGP